MNISSFDEIMQNYFDGKFSWDAAKFAMERLMDCYSALNNPKNNPIYKEGLPMYVEDAIGYLSDMAYILENPQREFTIEEIYAAMPVFNNVWSIEDIAEAAVDYLVVCGNEDLYGLD